MLGQVISRVWVVALLCLNSFGLPSRATAVQMPDPDLLMSETGLMLLVIDDVPGTMVKAKKFFDGVYKEHREKGVLGPLQTPLTQYIFQQAKGDQPTHWLIKAVDSIATEGTELEKVWRPIAEKLAKDPTQVTLEEEDEVIAAFARLFKGKMFIGEEDHKPYRTTIFGFEYDPQVFDWMSELRLIAARQRERYGYEDQSATVSGVEMIHLPNEGWFVFAVNDVVYGVVDRKSDGVFELVKKVLLINSDDLHEGGMRSCRHYQRVFATMIDRQVPCDLFMYVDMKKIFERTNNPASAIESEFVRDFSKGEKLYSDESGYSPGIGFCVRIDNDGRELTCEINQPTLVPFVGGIEKVKNGFRPIEIPKSIELSPNVTRTLAFHPAHSDYPVYCHPAPRNDLITTFASIMFYEDPDNEYHREMIESRDVLSVIQELASDDNTGFPIRYQRFSFPIAEYECRGTALEIPRTAVGTIDELCDRFNEQLVRKKYYARSLAYWSRQATPVFIGVDDLRSLLAREWDFSNNYGLPPRLDFQSIPDETLQLTIFGQTKKHGNFIVFAGFLSVDLILVQTDENIFAFSCEDSRLISALIDGLDFSNERLIEVPGSFWALLRPSDSVIQFLCISNNNMAGPSDNQRLFRQLSLHDGDMMSDDLSRQLVHETSVLYQFWSVVISEMKFVDYVNPNYAGHELFQLRKQHGLQFQALLFRDNSLVQIQSMMLGE
jgi:hypothetical protein